MTPSENIKNHIGELLEDARAAIAESKENPYRRQTWLFRAEEALRKADYYVGLLTGDFRRMP